MALSRIGTSADLANLFVRSSYAATNPRHGRQNVEQLHATVVRRYPEAPQLPLPSNVSEIFNIETSRFGPERARDMSAPLFLHGSRHIDGSPGADCSYGFADSVKMHQLDSRVDSYDCFGAVSLNGSMQTNVPKPFCAAGKSTYLNMPGGQWARDGKYLAEIMQKSHFTVYQMRQVKRSGGLDGLLHANPLLPRDSLGAARCYSTSGSGAAAATNTTGKMSGAAPRPGGTIEGEEGAKGTQQRQPPVNLSKREKLRIIVRDYGRTIIAFHIGISLVSLGIFYSLVSRGVDMTPLIQLFSQGTPEKVAEDQIVSKIMGGGSTFLIAYGIHKLFAPVRLTLTIGFAPPLVRYLRRKGILKPPKITAATGSAAGKTTAATGTSRTSAAR